MNTTMQHRRARGAASVISVLLCVLALGACGGGGGGGSGGGGSRTLVWSDEFDGADNSPPNPANWNYHVGNGYNSGASAFQGWGNGEWEWYRPENSYQHSGNLVIRADYNTDPTFLHGRNWYQFSSRLTTHGKHSWTYGKIEARIRLPNKIGTWPAFWMLGDSSGASYTSEYNPPADHYDTMATHWPSCGEIDIMEHVNTNTTTIQNVFWDTRIGEYPWAPDITASYSHSATVGDVSAFHVYDIEWDADYIRWHIDGVQVHVIRITPSVAPTLEEFHKPFHLILNLAISGGLTGPSDPSIADFPLYMYVDYVRVYQ